MDTEVAWEQVSFEDTSLINTISSHVYKTIRERKHGKAYASFKSINNAVLLMSYAESLWICKRKSDGAFIGVVAFEIDRPWWSDKTCLEEIFVIQINPSFYGFGRLALNFMKTKAKAYGCALMETGASMTDKPELLESLYHKKGKCTFTYPNFVWLMGSN